jgi:hypothetical protein
VSVCQGDYEGNCRGSRKLVVLRPEQEECRRQLVLGVTSSTSIEVMPKL